MPYLADECSEYLTLIRDHKDAKSSHKPSAAILHEDYEVDDRS